MGIWGRLGDLIKSYLNDEDDKIHWRGTSGGPTPNRRSRYGTGFSQSDPDMDAAYEELDEFLKGKDSSEKPTGGGTGKQAEGKRSRPVPTEIQEDFAVLGLSPQARAEECKAAYKKLLKAHHPDRHAGNPETMKNATEKTARVNAAYKRLEKWFRFLNDSAS